ncbi:MAG: flagellar motor stator protein MotA [bacterium]|nr:flagellar motor stator protein MotA [bacterium]
MFAIIGILVVIGAVVGGYLMEHGHLEVLFQPAELVIIGGAALGTVLIANPLAILKKIISGLLGVLKGSRFTKALFLSTLNLLSDVFAHARKQGMDKLEADVEKPESSQLFSKYPEFLKDHHAVAFLCDTLRVAIAGGLNEHQLDEMMETDMEVHHTESEVPVAALTTVADSLPGLGIVAAVLGVVITMGSLGGPPEEIGHKVAAALVGTFLGILLCYGFLAPLASNMAKNNAQEGYYLGCLRAGVIAFIKGAPPLMAVEFARRTIPSELRPTFQEMEDTCKGRKAAS